MNTCRPIAYFSMEVALQPDIPTYSGGLGVLAGDTLRSAADLQLPMAAVTLLHRNGYLVQQFDRSGWQQEILPEFDVEKHFEEMPARALIRIEGRNVHLRAWKYEIHGQDGGVLPVFLLDTDLPENTDWDRGLSGHLYGGDEHYRLCQEVVLGIGGVRMLRALGYTQIHRFHMNEGHAALLTLELLNESRTAAGRREITSADVSAVQQQCVFTTHTPVAAGHDRFSLDHARRVIGHDVFDTQEPIRWDGTLNMTSLALHFSHYVNGVAKRHGEVSREMFPEFQIGWITNGVHAGTWTCPSFQQLFDRFTPNWREYGAALRNAVTIPDEEIWNAHFEAKRGLLAFVKESTGVELSPNVLTLGFGRRITAYKRPDLLLSNLERLHQIADEGGDLQIVYAGKAHPRDDHGKAIIQRIFEAQRQNRQSPLQIVFVPEYDMRVGALITSGVDVWVNTPQPPLEASGTSGMKAALNGVPSLSVLDGWWVEGCVEGITGWAVGPDRHAAGRDHSEDADILYDKLQNVVLPTYYFDPKRFVDVMRHTIAFNAPYFNTHRMVREYMLHAYLS